MISRAPFRPAAAPSVPVIAVAAVLAIAFGARAAHAEPVGEVTLEQIMADPDWIGNPPEKAYWADDGRSVYYQRKQQGKEERDLFRLRLAERTPRLVPYAERGAADAPDGEVSLDRRWKVYSRQGDTYLKDLRGGAIRQVTRTAEEKTEPRFMTGGRRISFRIKNAYFIYDLDTGLFSQPADLRLDKDPAREDPPDFLRRQEQRLFQVIREKKEKERAKREQSEAEQRADATRPPLPFYLGDKVRIEDVSLSPAGDWLVVVTRPKEAKEGKKVSMPNYVTESGYVEFKEIRSLVGTGDGTGQSLLLLDLRRHRCHDLDLSELPGIKEDPLKGLRQAAAERTKAAGPARHGKEAAPASSAGAGPSGCGPQDETEAAAGKAEGDEGSAGRGEAGKKVPETRSVHVEGIRWSDDGRQAAVELRALDDKDRWIATLDLDGSRLVTRHRLSDGAWVNWNNNDFGWLRDNETLYYLSEESGFSHLYLASARGGHARQLTSGRYEVTKPVASRDGRYLYYTANASHPGNYDVWRVALDTGKAEQLTRLGGLTAFQLSLDESELLLAHSSLARHDELYVQASRPGAEARQITDTVSAAFRNIAWTVPEILPIPSTHGAGAIYSRVYTPSAGADRVAGRGGSGGGRAAVVFIHGAGYLQDAHYGWSYYFHEFMFHTLLARHGYVVLDMDYRASQGYGRDWRTAIYRQMGHPELEDLADGVGWLAEKSGVDPRRVGVYGGSYGGFLTLMALFRRPDLFAAGAALRPVTDWSHYNQDYTGAILNTPEVDPDAYATSSPIEYAEGLRKPLLMCAGMQDDNVLFQDDVRLVQRLIELEKEDFEMAFYPVESHGFKDAASWLDEYRRIYRLFRRVLHPAGSE